MLNPVAQLNLTCPSGGDFYICQRSTTQFIGCCTFNPCTAGGLCPQANLRSSSFEKSDYKIILPQICTDATAKWYTCTEGSTPFLGCCTSDACSANEGCPTKDLAAAILSNEKNNSAIFITPISGTLSATISEPSATRTAPSISDSQRSGSSGLPVGTLTGIIIGCVGFIGFCILALLFTKRMLSKRLDSKQSTQQSHSQWFTSDSARSRTSQFHTLDDHRTDPFMPQKLHRNQPTALKLLPATYRPYRPPVEPFYELE